MATINACTRSLVYGIPCAEFECFHFICFFHCLFYLLRPSTAIGYGLSNGSFALALSSYFRVRLNRASGVAMTLAGIGPILYPPLIQYLLINYDVNGCMMIIGAVALHMLIGAVLLQPIEWHLVSASNANDIDAKDQKSCDFVSKCSLCHPAPMRTVTTLQSIGKLSDASCKAFVIDIRFHVSPIECTFMIFSCAHGQQSTTFVVRDHVRTFRDTIAFLHRS